MYFRPKTFGSPNKKATLEFLKQLIKDIETGKVGVYDVIKRKNYREYWTNEFEVEHKPEDVELTITYVEKE